MVASADNFFDRGVAKVKDVVSETSIEQRNFLKTFVQTCTDGHQAGWHEHNGGNMSYRMRNEEVRACRSYFNEILGEWIMLGVQADSLRGEHFLVTGTGSQFRTIHRDPAGSIGIIEINAAGDAYRVVWGFKRQGRPTSEFTSHFIIHAVRKVKSNEADRVVYHGHPLHSCTMSITSPFDDHSLTRLLWQVLPESIMFFPEGVGFVDWHNPGSRELAVATAEKMELFKAVVWKRHGTVCVGRSFEEAFGYVQSIEKAAAICCLGHTLEGTYEFGQALNDEEIREMGKALDLPLNEKFLS